MSAEENNDSVKNTSLFNQTSGPVTSRRLMARIIGRYVRPQLKPILISLSLMALGAMMTGFQALLMEHIIDKIFTEKNRELLMPVAFAVFMSFTLQGLATYGHSVTMAKVGQKIISVIQKDLFGKIIRLDLAFFHSNPSGTLISRMISDVMVMRMAVSDGLTAVGKNVVTLVFLVGVMFYQDWKLSLSCFIVFPLAGLYVSKLGRKLRKVSSSTQEELGFFASALTQVFQGVRQVKAYNMEDGEGTRVGRNIDRLFSLSYKAAKVSNLSGPVSEVLTAVAIVTIILYGGEQVMTGHKTAGSLFSFITAFIMAYEPLKRLAKLNNSIQVGLAAAERVFRIMDTPRHITDKENAAELNALNPEIMLDNVDFYYADGTHALKNVSIKVPRGKKAALVGASGSGKSTLLNLIPRFYDVNGGSVKIDGTDVRDVTLHSLRNHIAFVSQEVIMFDDTIKANIAYGKPDATDEEIIGAAKDAAAHDFIMAQDEGYNTRIGENGLKLSGGQRQRIAIARAMLINAPILLMDEATSALDTESERLVQAALARLQSGRTTLVVAHRLSTVIDADTIYVMNEGEVVEFGTHAELIARGGIYGKLYGMMSSSDTETVG